MNINRSYIIAFLLMLVTCSCEFNEDFCIRNGELVAFCDFSGIEKEEVPFTAHQHLLAYGRTDLTHPYSKVTFTEDTLCFRTPQGFYDFYFLYTSDCQLLQEKEYGLCTLAVDTLSLNGKKYISKPGTFIGISRFSEQLNYQEPIVREIHPEPFSQHVIIRLHIDGNYQPLLGIHSELTGVAFAKNLSTSRITNDHAIYRSIFLPKGEDRRVWTASGHVLGFHPHVDNILSVTTETSDTSNDTYRINLTPYLRGFDKYQIIIDLDLTVGKELELKNPVAIEGWEDHHGSEF